MNFSVDDKKRQIVILVIALALATGASLLVANYITSETNKRTEQLARDFKAKSDAEKEGMKKQLEQMYQDMDGKLKQAMEEMKKAAPKEVVKDEPKSPAVLPLSKKMPDGKRGVTIPIDPLSAVGGLINPGDFVDVIIDLKVPDPQKPAGETNSVTSMVFQNIEVLAVDARIQPTATQKDLEERLKSKSIQVTLAVSSEEAALLTFAQSNGKVTLSLRSNNEKTMQRVGVANWQSLSEFVEKNQGAKILSPEKPKTEEKKEEAKPYIQIFKSGVEY